MAPPDRVEEEEAVPPVSEAEMETAVERLRAKRTAPGPDGVPGRVLAVALQHLGEDLRDLFSRSLAAGRFPTVWKQGRLVLLRKEGRPLDSPASFRPIVLLDETGKVYERIVASRLIRHLTEVGPDLSDAQFGFRAGRSTLDALTSLRTWTTEAVDRGERALAVSLDIANAFNSLPHVVILDALRFFGVPRYMRRLLADYLRGREVLWEGCQGAGVLRRPVGRGVPQGSVLGPILWNMGYDWVLRGALLPRMRVLCYADDTLVVARGRSYEEAARLATVGTSLVVGRIRALGLQVTLQKTEALLFHGPRKGPPPGAALVVEGQRIPVGAHMKYLGLHLDGRWGFGEHFKLLAPRLVSAAAALGRLLPNIGGPDVGCRRLYQGVVRSMALYGAPVWVDALTASNKSLLRRPQRVIAVRAVRAYRTVSHAAACLLAGSPPWELEAEALAAMYHRFAAGRARGETPAPEEVHRLRRQAQETVLRRWEEDLAAPRYGLWTIGAIRPVLRDWVRRKRGFLTFRLVQVLSGHGCFGKYLQQIARREPTAVCHQCGADEDTALHTLEECPAFGSQRGALVAAVGGDLSLPSLVNAMLDNGRSWEAMVSFCEEVMSRKEADERVREEDALADPLRRRRLGGRRRRYAHLLPP